MKALIGVLYALGGLALGFVLFAGAAAVFAHLSRMSNREGAAGYFMVAIGLLGALIGLGLGLWLHARSAPAGQAWPQFGQGALGLAVLLALLVGGGWAWMQLREGPLSYEGNTYANLELEFRIARAALPAEPPPRWLSVDVNTTNTRPEAHILWDKARDEGAHRVLGAVQGPLVRSGNRLIVARVRLGGESHDELFLPAMPRTPDPRGDWSAWRKPAQVAHGQEADSGQPGLLEMRWRVRLYGD